MQPNVKKMATNLYDIQDLIRQLHIYSLDDDKILSKIASKLYELKECDNGLYDATELIDNDKCYNNYINKLDLRDKINGLKVKSKDFECCLEILNELEKLLEE